MGTVQYGIIGLVAASNASSTGSVTNAINLLGPGTCILILALVILVSFLTAKATSNRSADNDSTNKKENSMDNVIAHIVENEEDELSSDSELVAVITAAIQASMGETAPVGGFIVRSIRKKNTR